MSETSNPTTLDTGDATPPMAECNDHRILVTCDNNSFSCLTNDSVDPTADIIYTTLQPLVNNYLDVHNTADNTASEMTSDNDNDECKIDINTLGPIVSKSVEHGMMIVVDQALQNKAVSLL